MIIRRKLDHGYTSVPRATFEDSRLTYEARGLLAYLLVKPNDWQVHVTDLCRRAGPKPCGRERIYRILNELKAVGYVTFHQPYGEGHRVLPGEYVVTDTAPDPVAKAPQSENPHAEFPHAENPTAYKELTPTDYEVNQTPSAPHVAARGAAQRATSPSKSKAGRQPKPLYDAFKAAFPAAHSSLAGRFDSTCVGRGFTVDLWHAFMATADARKDYLRGTLTMGNALNRFVAWCDDQAPARPSTDKPAGAPDNWRSLVYSYDGTRLWPALALPRMGLDPHAPPATWPAWYRAFEGAAA